MTQVPHGDLDRRGLDQVGGERRRRFRRNVRNDEGHVLLPARFDPAGHARGMESLRGGNAPPLITFGSIFFVVFISGPAFRQTGGQIGRLNGL